MAAVVLRKIIRLLEFISSIVLVVMVLLTFIDVIGRYIFSAPIFGASEMISSMLALLIFLGLGIANAQDKHIVVELFDSNLRSLSPKAYDFIVQGFSICTMCLIVYVLAAQAIHNFEVEAKTVVLEWPLSWITGTVALFAALSVICQVLGLFVGFDEQTEGGAL